MPATPREPILRQPPRGPAAHALRSRHAARLNRCGPRRAPLAPPPLSPPPPPAAPSHGANRFSSVFGGRRTLRWPSIHGRGLAAINYPIGMNLGGDPSQALVHSNPDGKFMVALSSIDLGQGMKSVTRQIAAETLGVPVEDVYVDTADSDTGPHCMGSFASRGTHRVGNAVIQAARRRAP